MNQSCTIIGRRVALDSVFDAVNSIDALAMLEQDGTRERWSRLRLNSECGSIQMTSMKFEEPGDRFSKSVLSMHNFFRNVESSSQSAKEQVLDHIDSADLLIGIVADPEFVSDDNRLDSVFSAAKAVDGLIFNGDGVVDPDGRLLLDSTGASELAID